MSKNIYDYSQPNFYKFSEDSINLSKEVLSLIECNFSEIYPLKGLDLFSGCGVVGLEIMRKTDRDISFDFIELQKDYKVSFNKNVQKFLKDDKIEKTRFLNINYLELRDGGDMKYDLIVSNPPYFYPEKNRMGQDHKKNLCRFFIDNTFSDFLTFIMESLSEKGIAAFLLREDEVKNELKNFVDCQEVLKIEKAKTLNKVSIFVATFLHK